MAVVVGRGRARREGLVAEALRPWKTRKYMRKE
jgi:hypothetical protein